MAETCHRLELDVLLGKTNTYENVSELLQYVVEGKYESALKTPTAQKILTANTHSTNQLEIIVMKNVEDFMSQETDVSQLNREMELLAVAVSCLQIFVQNNWVGPVTQTNFTEHLPDCFSGEDEQKAVNELMLSELSVDGEPVYENCDRLVYLYLAYCIMYKCQNHFKNLQLGDWWLMRCLMMQQHILDDKSPTLKEVIIGIVDKMQEQTSQISCENKREMLIQFHLEAGYNCIYFYEYKKAHEHFTEAKKIGGLNLELTGAMGKRTKYQQEAKAQLVLKITRESSDTSDNCKDSAAERHIIPQVFSLDDDTVLNVINFDDKDEVFSTDLSPLEQALVVGMMENYRRSHAAVEKLTDEEVHAYFDAILPQVKNWPVAVHLSVLRSKMEKHSGRRVERSMKQIEEMVTQTRQQTPPAAPRLYLFYSVQVLPVWMIQKQLAEILITLGAIGSALDTYQELHMWDDVIMCYKRMGKMEKAETVIRDQIAIKETPNMLCFLGDVTRDMACYEKAWETSNHKSARAARCMAYQHFGDEKYDLALEWFDKSLKINNLQIPVWFTCGCCALAANKYEKAVRAFKSCVNIDYDNFEAWNNMATAYVKLNDKPKAFRVLKEAVRFGYDNWRVWENLLFTATDCGEFNEAINAYNRLIDIKGKWSDSQVLEILVKSVVEGIPDAHGTVPVLMKLKLQTLFGRITASVTSNAKIWKLYAKLSDFTGEKTPENQEKVLQYLRKSHRCLIQDDKWEQDEKKCKDVVQQSIELSDLYEKACDNAEAQTVKVQHLSSAKLMLKGILSKIQKHYTDPISGALADSMKDTCTELDSKLQHFVNKLSEVQGKS